MKRFTTKHLSYTLTGIKSQLIFTFHLSQCFNMVLTCNLVSVQHLYFLNGYLRLYMQGLIFGHLQIEFPLLTRPVLSIDVAVFVAEHNYKTLDRIISFRQVIWETISDFIPVLLLMVLKKILHRDHTGNRYINMKFSDRYQHPSHCGIFKTFTAICAILQFMFNQFLLNLMMPTRQ